MRNRTTLFTAVALVLAGYGGTSLAQVAPVDDSGLSTGQQQPAGSGAPDHPPATLPRLDWAIGLGAGHTDNVDRSSTNPTGQNILQPTFNFTFNQQGSTVQAQAVGAIQYVDYLQSYFGNEFRGQLTGLLNWTISPDRLNFVAQDYSSVEPVSIRFGNSPANQQQVNVLVAGPTLSFRLGANGSWNGQADLRYIDTTASKTKDFDSQRGLAAFRLLHDLSPTNHLSFNLETEQVHFETVDPISGFSRYGENSLYGSYTSNLPHLDFSIALGGSRVNFPSGFANHTGPFASATVAWRLDARSTFSLSGSNRLTDATTNLSEAPTSASTNLTTPTFTVGGTAIAPAVYRNQSLYLSYTYQGPRFGFAVSPFYARLRQLNSNDLSRNDHGVSVDASYLLTPLTTLAVNLGDQKTEYLSDSSHARDRTARITLSRQLTPHWSWSVAFSSDHRSADQPGYGYAENEIFAYIYYRR